MLYFGHAIALIAGSNRSSDHQREQFLLALVDVGPGKPEREPKLVGGSTKFLPDLIHWSYIGLAGICALVSFVYPMKALSDGPRKKL